MKVLRGKKALITGAGNGIGRGIALALAREGVALYLVDIDDAGLESVADEARRHDVEAVTRHCDLADLAQIPTLVDTLLADWGELNILVNNAGICDRVAIHEMSDAEWNRTITINFLAPVALTRRLLPMLLANEAHVLNVCSIFGLATARKAAAYQTSKFGLVGFTTALRAEYGTRRFGVTALCPGFVQTRLLSKIAEMQPDRMPPAWMSTTVDKIAKKALGAIRNDRGIVVVTAFAHIYWLLARLSPSLIDFFYRRPWRNWRAQ